MHLYLVDIVACVRIAVSPPLCVLYATNQGWKVSESSIDDIEIMKRRAASGFEEIFSSGNIVITFTSSTSQELRT